MAKAGDSHSVRSGDSYGTFSEHSHLDGSSDQTWPGTQLMKSGKGKASLNWTTKYWLKEAAALVYDQYFLVGITSLIAIASQKQVPLAQQEIKETVITYLCVAVIFFVTGCTLATGLLKEQFLRWRLHLFCQIQSFVLTSAIVFGVVSACASDPDFMDAGLLVGFILLGCVPTTISSNIVMTEQAKGNQALTVVQSTIGNFLGPFVAPPLILLYLSCGAWYTDVVPNVNAKDFFAMYGRIGKQLGLSIFLPLFLGQCVQWLFPKATQKIFKDWMVSKVSSIALMLIVWQTYDSAFATNAFSSVKPSNIIFLIFICIAFYAIWTVLCFSMSLPWLSNEDSVAVAYIVPAKTPAIGVPLSEAMFAGLSPVLNSKLQIPVVIFQGLQVIAGSLLTIAFRKWLARGQKDKDENLEDGSSAHDSAGGGH